MESILDAENQHVKNDGTAWLARRFEQQQQQIYVQLTWTSRVQLPGHHGEQDNRMRVVPCSVLFLPTGMAD